MKKMLVVIGLLSVLVLAAAICRRPTADVRGGIVDTLYRTP